MTPPVSRSVGGATRKAAPVVLLALVLMLPSAVSRPILAAGQSAGDGAQKARQVSSLIKIELKPKAPSAVVGEDARFELRLVDADGHAIKAPKDLKISIAATSAGSQRLSRTVTVKKNATSENFELDFDAFKSAGLVEVAAKHFELLDGGTLLYLKPAKAAVPRSLPSKKSSAIVPGPTSGVLVPDRALPPGYAIVTAALASSAVAPPPIEPTVTLDFAPKRPFLADGEDGASVAVILARPFAADVQVHLQTTAGTLQPNPISIPAGEFMGRTTLKSDGVGKAVVTYLTSTPATDLATDQTLAIDFRPPITGFELLVAPQTFTWIDRGRITVRLLRSKDGKTTPIATDALRRVSLSMSLGRGEVTPAQIDIVPGNFDGHADLLPFESGRFHVTAAIPDFIQQERDVDVTAIPYLGLLLTCLGGSAGGLVAFLTRKGAKWWRIVIGLVSGMVLYWAFIFGLLPNLPRAVVLNPLSAFALPAMGGWLGTAVFSGLAKKLGLPT